MEKVKVKLCCSSVSILTGSPDWAIAGDTDARQCRQSWRWEMTSKSSWSLWSTQILPAFWTSWESEARALLWKQEISFFDKVLLSLLSWHYWLRTPAGVKSIHGAGEKTLTLSILSEECKRRRMCGISVYTSEALALIVKTQGRGWGSSQVGGRRTDTASSARGGWEGWWIPWRRKGAIEVEGIYSHHFSFLLNSLGLSFSK